MSDQGINSENRVKCLFHAKLFRNSEIISSLIQKNGAKTSFSWKIIT